MLQTGSLSEAAEKERIVNFSRINSCSFSTIRMADLILILDKGELAEMGTHEKLLEKVGSYMQSCLFCRRWDISDAE